MMARRHVSSITNTFKHSHTFLAHFRYVACCSQYDDGGDGDESLARHNDRLIFRVGLMAHLEGKQLLINILCAENKLEIMGLSQRLSERHVLFTCLLLPKKENKNIKFSLFIYFHFLLFLSLAW
jgi:hypothetical protein